MLGWYFSTSDRMLCHGDNRPIVVGETHVIDGEPALCKRGLHASRRILDALDYRPGPILYRVRLSGTIVHGQDKACATRRTYLAEIDATEMLRAFGRSCARDVIHLWDAPEVVRRYLETGDDSIRVAALDAAKAVAGIAVWDVASAAARAAVGAATWPASAAADDAAEDAAWAAAWAAWAAAARAAWDAAGAAAWDASWDAARDVWTTIWRATRDAARSKQENRLHRMARAALAQVHAVVE